MDNSVVVAENILRMHKEGLPRREACIRGAGEIALAITMATLTTVIVFVPVSLVEGEAQFFLLRMALPVRSRSWRRSWSPWSSSRWPST